MSDSRPLPLHQETHGAEDNESHAEALEASVQTVSRMALTHAWAPSRLFTARLSYTAYVVSLGSGDVRPVRARVSLSGEDSGRNDGELYIIKEHSEAGRHLCTPNPAGLHAGGSI